MELTLLNVYLCSLDVMKMRIHFRKVSTQQEKKPTGFSYLLPELQVLCILWLLGRSPTSPQDPHLGTWKQMGSLTTEPAQL